MLTIPRRMIKGWCRVDKEPGYLLTTGAKIKQSSVKIEEVKCITCKKETPELDEPAREEAYIRRFESCVKCHVRILFPDDEEKQNKYFMNMSCKRSVGTWGEMYKVDQMLRTVTKAIY